MRTVVLFTVLLTAFYACQNKQVDTNETKSISSEIVTTVTSQLTTTYPNQSFRIERGVAQVANLWRKPDGTNDDFKTFCNEYFIADENELETVFNTISRNLEILNGHFNQITVSLLEPLHLDIGDIHKIDHIFGAYSVGAHLWDDFYKNKLAFIIALNFPNYPLSEKNELGKNWDRKQWAYARMGDLFTARVPAYLTQSLSETATKADSYIADYNIYVGNLLDSNNQTLFPKELKLLSHWNLRDEIKSNYADKEHGLEKQRLIYRVMERIIDQTIPNEIINSNRYLWNPETNEVFENDSKVANNPEPNIRYQQIINYFNEYKKIDKYYSNQNTYIKRAFDDGMEISQQDVEKLFIEFVSSPLVKQVGKIISERIGRDLEPFDIWYDGFKSRSSLDQNKLDKTTRLLYPNAEAFKNQMPNMLTTLGFSTDKAKYLADKIVVDPARGSGHAWGGAMKGDVAHLRTRIGKEGMDYKGFNIAVHEFGHNVEQTISLYDVDYYMLNGVPNTAFTEALAFMFQKRDLQILKINNNSELDSYENTLDQFWSIFEIMGVSLVDMRVWKWLYQNPDATSEQLKFQVISIAKEVWNEFYAPVFDIKDQTILAIYSHMIASPLYLSAYPFGLLIDFQLENYINDKNFATEVERIFKLGRLTPDSWINQATGNSISLEPIFKCTENAIKNLE